MRGNMNHKAEGCRCGHVCYRSIYIIISIILSRQLLTFNSIMTRRTLKKGVLDSW